MLIMFSLIEMRHSISSGQSSVQHLLTEKPIVKGLSFKSKNKSSPRNSPKLASNLDTNLLEKYKLPKPPVNKPGGKFTPGLLEQNNSALAKQLRSCGVQPVVALDDVARNASMLTPSSVVVQTESLTASALTPTSSLAAKSDLVASNGRQFTSKRSLDSSLSNFPKAEPPKKVKYEPAVDSRVKEERRVRQVAITEAEVIRRFPSPPSPLEPPTEAPSPKPMFSISETETTFINTSKSEVPQSKIHQITTFDKSIPCKGNVC